MSRQAQIIPNLIHRKRITIITYKNSKKSTGDGTVDRDHNPPKQALIERAEEIKGESLTKAEKKRISENSDTITLPKEVHQQASSSKGYNSSRAKEDAQNLQSATQKYSNEHITNSKGTEHADSIKEGTKKMDSKTNEEYDKFLKQQLNKNN